MLASLDVIDMKWQRINGSRQVAVLHDLRALPDLMGNISSHEEGGRLASS
jgi:hypothetical protein